MASNHPIITIDALPPELLTQVFSFFDVPAPSDTRLHDEPEIDMLKASDTPLKYISLVSKRWRAISLPLLFRHVVWVLDRWDLPQTAPSEAEDPIDSFPLLAFLRASDLARHVVSFTMLVSNRMEPVIRRRRSRHGSRSFSASGIETRPQPTDEEIDGLLRNFQYQLSTAAAAHNEDNNWLWDMLFSLVDVQRFTIIASPQMLASLLSCMLFLGDADSFSHRHLLHILSLSVDPKARRTKTEGKLRSNSPSQVVPEPQPAPSHSCGCRRERKRTRSSLFTIRPWTNLLLNEGSSIRVYRNYEYFFRRPPSILGALLGSEEAPNDVALIPSTIRSLSYVAIFPLTTHFCSIIDNLPPIDRLFVQLVPRNNVLLDPEEMRNVQASDLWMERNSCYSLLLRKLLADGAFGAGDDDAETENAGNAQGGSSSGRRALSNWRRLREFESGDAADKEAWEMAVHWIESSGTGWRVEREGVFVRGPRSNPTPGSNSGSQAGLDGGTADDEEGGPNMETDIFPV
ncbi:hypothetical protein N656DRAFT_778131 [Canariomyces notabilis]|uniref:F-box domain-containing protein n=1 Tax=Canariomyces notabilis TaxID=2074819 RepID=A0AAN6YT65_9PEZI|nr:hypothetical protein N656DRAFT_778131 [Canariomyces arenarius]